MKDLRVCAVVVPVCRREGCGVITERPDGWLRARCDDCTAALLHAFSPIATTPGWAPGTRAFPPAPGSGSLQVAATVTTAGATG